jgi:hypothetical protein
MTPRPSRALVKYRAREAARLIVLKLVQSWQKAGVSIPEQKRKIRVLRRALREFHKEDTQ